MIQLSKRAIHEEQKKFELQLEKGRPVTPSEIEARVTVFGLKLEICYYFEAWLTILAILLGGIFLNFVRNRDTPAFIYLIVIFWVIVGIWQLLSLQRKLDQASKNDPLAKDFPESGQ